ncbi:MAG: ABC transporter permease [Chloroflexia bacterium]
MLLYGRKIWRDLRARPGRSLLTWAGIAIGVAGVVAIALAGRTLVRVQRYAYQHHSQADITVWVWDADEALIRALEQLPTVAEAERRAVTFSKWRIGSYWLDIELQGVESFDTVRVNQMSWIEGHPPERGEIALELSVREFAPVELGDIVEIRGPEGETLRLQVSGFTRTPYYPSSALMRLAVGYLPASAVRPFLGTRGDNRLLIRLREGHTLDEAAAEVRALLDRRQTPHGELELRHPEAFTGHRELRTVLHLMTAVSVLGLVIGAFLVGNTFAALVAEQVREIGILKALGATRSVVLRLHLEGGMAFATAGTLTGILLGWGSGYLLLRYLGRLLNVDVGLPVLDAKALMLGCAVGFGVTLPSALLPVWRASRVTVREALGGYGIRAEPPAIGRSSGHLPVWWGMAFREFLRRPTRTAVRVVVAAIAVGAFLSTRITEVSLERAIRDLFRIYVADAWVWFEAPVGAGFAAELRTVPGVTEAEGWEIRSAVVGGELVRLWGLPPQTALYRYELAGGRWLLPGETDGAVVSLDLAQRQKLHIGSTLDVEVAGRLRPVHLVGIVRDEAIFGLGDAPMGKVFLALGTVQQMARLGDHVGVFAVRCSDPSPGGVERVLKGIERKFRSLGPGTEPARTGVEQARDATRIVRGLLYATVALVSLTGAVGIANIQWLTVWERLREIGVLRSLGAQRRHLLVMLATEGALCGAVAAALAVPWGIAGGSVLGSIIGAALIHLPLVVRAADLAWAGLFAIGLSILAAVVPAWGASRWPVYEVLRYE